MGGRIPGPVCQATKPQWILDGTTNRQCTPNRQPVFSEDACVSRAQSSVSLKTLLFDGEQLLRFFRSVAFAKVTAGKTRIQWVPYKDSKVLNIIYGLMPWKGAPGTVEVIIENEQLLGLEIQEEADKLMDEFLLNLAEQPAKAVAFLSNKEKLRTMNLETIQNAYQMAQEISRDLIAETQRGIKNLAEIKMASTIALKTMGLATGASFLVSLGYDVTLEYIKELGKSGEIGLAGIAAVKKGGEETGKHAVEKSAHHAADKLLRKEAGYEKEIAKLEDKIEAIERQLETNIKQKRRNKMLQRLDSRQGALATQQKELQSSKFKVKALSSVKFLFFAYDVYEAVHEYHEETKF